MNNKFKILGIAVLIVLALSALGAGVAFARYIYPSHGINIGWMMGGRVNNPNGYGMMGNYPQNNRGYGMMGGYSQNGNGWEWMDAMHDWMLATGGMHTFVWNAVAEKLGLTVDQLYAELRSGKTITQIANEKGVSRADLVTALETAHKNSVAQAVKDGYITQAQADNILSLMTGRYEWMLDNMGAGYPMMGWPGMMGGYPGQRGSSPSQSRP